METQSEPQSKHSLVAEFHSEKGIVASTIRDVYIGTNQSMPYPLLLPPDLPRFTGRQKELSEIEQLLSKRESVLTVCGFCGMGGIGKSALAIHAAHRLHQAGYFPDGILWADLGASSVDEILEEFIRAFGYLDDQIPSDYFGKIGLYRSILKNKNILVGLDNAQGDEQVVKLLSNTPSAKVIITSRNKMIGLGEYTTLIQDLDVFPIQDALDLLAQYAPDRCQLEPEATKEICELVGFLPLAIDIAGARITNNRRWPRLSFFAEQLRDELLRLDELRIGDRKERDLRAVLALSYNALHDYQKKNFCFLALFGGFNFGSSKAMAVLQIDKKTSIERLEELVELSLLSRSNRGGYKIHELLRLYADERLKQETDEDEILSAEDRLLEYTISVTQAQTLGAQAAAYFRLGNLTEAITAYQQAMEINKSLSHRHGEASTLGGLAAAYCFKCDWDNAVYYFKQSQELNEKIGNIAGQAISLGGLASAYAGMRNWDKAIEYCMKSQGLNEKFGTPRRQACDFGGLASVRWKTRLGQSH